MSLVALANIQCQYQQHRVADQLSLQVAEGDITGLLGASGCGKTTVLRAIAGFIPLTQGEIYIDQQLVSSSRFSLPPEQRHLGMVFQDYSLFPHLNIYANIAFGLNRLSKKQQANTVAEMLEIVGLPSIAQHYPHQLSGGQQQRVALARALAPKPKLILMDEPFSSLDIELRERLQIDIRQILKQQAMTAIWVTHDQKEAFVVCDQVAVMYQGRIVQHDSPYELYHYPKNSFVADFIGQGQFLCGKRKNSTQVDTELGLLQCLENQSTQLKVLIRPEDILLADSGYLVQVVDKLFYGGDTIYYLKLASGQQLFANFPSHLDYAINEQLTIRLRQKSFAVFPDTEFCSTS